MRIMQSEKYLGKDYWAWAVWVEGSATELGAIESVTYTLHPTFYNPVRNVTDRRSKFRLEAGGWGTFTIYARINMKDGKRSDLKHELSLTYPNGEEADTVLIRIGNIEPDTTDKHAKALKDAILDVSPEATVKRERAKTTDGDLSILLAAPDVPSITKGIKGWLTQNPDVTLDLVRSGETVAANVNASSVAKVMRSLSSSSNALRSISKASPRR